LETDILVLGSGIAGLTFAIKVAEYYSDLGEEIQIDIFSKAELEESNTKYAQGGIAAVLNSLEDSFDKHIEDTISCGGGLPNKEIVNRVVKEAPKQIKSLINWGTQFDKNENGSFNLAKEGGHSEHRILHSKDSTGLEIEKTLLRKANSFKSIHLHYNRFAIDLLMHNCECIGALIVDELKQNVQTVTASYTLLATGGIGQVYEKTTNPVVATGDGIAMAYRAGAKVSGMEFVQFHPTALWSKDSPAFLISEAVRGFGGLLKSAHGNDFCAKYDFRASLAPRDIVARAIAFELQATKLPFVNLEVAHLDIKSFEKHFPKISQKCKSEGLDLAIDSIPVVPAAHYLCGGVEVDRNGLTSIKGLLACGECANTGLHGSNRLASNSLLEGMAYAEFCFIYIINNRRQKTSIYLPDKFYVYIPAHSLKVLKEKVKQIMSANVNIVKSTKGLVSALVKISALEKAFSSFETKSSIDVATLEYANMLTVSKLIIEQALSRKENIGLHYLKDLDDAYTSRK